MKAIRSIPGFMLLIILMVGCKKEENNLILSESKIEFDYTDDEATVMINNAGGDDFTWTATASDNCVSFSPATGHCSKNSPDEVKIIVNRYNVHKDSTTSTVTITTSSGESRQISLLIHGYPESKMRLNGSVNDAAYDPVHDLLLLICNSQLKIFDLKDNSFTTITTSASLSYVSVAPDGSCAVTRSNSGSIICIDLLQKKLDKTYSVGGYYYKVYACNNNMGYYFDDYTLSQIDLSNGHRQNFSLSAYLDPDAVTVHPSGNYIYGADYSSLFKINVSGSTPFLSYTTNLYNLNSTIMASSDGQKLFTGTSSVLKINPQASGLDITSTETFNMWQSYCYLAVQNQPKHEYYVVPSESSYGPDNNSESIIVFDEQMAPKDTIQLEKYYVPYYNGTYTLEDAVAEYLFSSSDGNRVIAVTRTYYSSGSYWGVEIINR